ncbi:MAG: hypothetical protein GYB64_07250 [Chloroflexi bacterium]|nr:hypothetical protein [Chloroflexota bacterium]
MKTWYRYEPPQAYKQWMVHILVTALMLVIIGIVALLRSTLPILVSPVVVTLVFLLAFAAVPLIATAYTTADLATDADGIHVDVLGLFRHEVSWAMLRYASVWEIAPPPYVRYLTLRQWDTVYVVYVPGLRGMAANGVFYGLGRVSALVITPDHTNSDRLLRRIKHLQHPMGKKKPRYTRLKE